jgi:hypothetical protein
MGLPRAGSGAWLRSWQVGQWFSRGSIKALCCFGRAYLWLSLFWFPAASYPMKRYAGHFMVRGGVKDRSHACCWLTVVPHDAAHRGIVAGP